MGPERVAERRRGFVDEKRWRLKESSHGCIIIVVIRTRQQKMQRVQLSSAFPSMSTLHYQGNSHTRQERQCTTLSAKLCGEQRLPITAAKKRTNRGNIGISVLPWWLGCICFRLRDIFSNWCSIRRCNRTRTICAFCLCLGRRFLRFLCRLIHD